jgi:hypothetical protein
MARAGPRIGHRRGVSPVSGPPRAVYASACGYLLQTARKERENNREIPGNHPGLSVVLFRLLISSLASAIARVIYCASGLGPFDQTVGSYRNSRTS